jgi:hypothetical protein
MIRGERSVEYTLGMCVGEGAEDLPGVGKGDFQRYRSTVEQLAQGGAFDEFGGYQKIALVTERLADPRNVGVLESGLAGGVLQTALGTLIIDGAADHTEEIGLMDATIFDTKEFVGTGRSDLLDDVVLSYGDAWLVSHGCSIGTFAPVV